MQNVLGHTLYEDQFLHQGFSLKAEHKNYYAIMQNDGNFVIYNFITSDICKGVWDSGSCNKGTSPFKLALQKNGNLVIYDGKGHATWASDTWNKGKGPFMLVMQDDRNLVLYDSQHIPLWASNTVT